MATSARWRNCKSTGTFGLLDVTKNLEAAPNQLMRVFIITPDGERHRRRLLGGAKA